MLPKNVSNFFDDRRNFNKQLLTNFIITTLSTDKVIFSKDRESEYIVLNANERKFGLFYLEWHLEKLKYIHFRPIGESKINELMEKYEKDCKSIEECAAILHQSKLDTKYVKIKLGAAITKLHEELQKLPKKLIEENTGKFLGPAIHTLHGFLGNNLKTK